MHKVYAHILVSLASVLLFVSCTANNEGIEPVGKLCLSLGQVSTHVETRAVPAQLSTPLVSSFQLQVVKQETQREVYAGRFVPQLELGVGAYQITATSGEDVVVGRDTPYYIGRAEVAIEAGQSAQVTIPCKVGNALVSVCFGGDEEERARFNRHYSEYGLLVRVGDYSMSINQDETASSIYFPAGSSPELVFFGTLASDGRVVSTPISHPNVPTTFQAADHARLILSLPDSESALGVFISKAELQTVNIEETIPLSWLPLPTVAANHRTADEQLVGTDLQFSAAYPGMKWEAEVTNSDDQLVRTVSGEGALLSSYTNQQWPFLPAGKYKATFYLEADGERAKVGSREFMIAAPSIRIDATGYTSYDKYKEGEIEAANSLNGLTIYEPQLRVFIAPSIVNDSRYGYAFTASFNGETQAVSGNVKAFSNVQVGAKLEAYNLIGTLTFGGTTYTATKPFYVTGIPFSFAPPTTDKWASSGDVSDEGSYILLGKNALTGEQSITYNVAIPSQTQLAVSYKVYNRAGLSLSNTLSLTIGNQTIFTDARKGAAFSADDNTLDEEKQVTMNAASTSVKFTNDGGRAQSYSQVERIAVRYR